jgi:hypothetical protein
MHKVNACYELPPHPKEVLMNVLFLLLDTETVMDKTLL